MLVVAVMDIRVFTVKQVLFFGLSSIEQVNDDFFLFSDINECASNPW